MCLNIRINLINIEAWGILSKRNLVLCWEKWENWENPSLVAKAALEYNEKCYVRRKMRSPNWPCHYYRFFIWVELVVSAMRQALRSAASLTHLWPYNIASCSIIRLPVVLKLIRGVGKV